MVASLAGLAGCGSGISSASAGKVAAISTTGPQLAYLWSAGDKSLRPLLGVAGSAVVGASVITPGAIRWRDSLCSFIYRRAAACGRLTGCGEPSLRECNPHASHADARSAAALVAERHSRDCLRQDWNTGPPLKPCGDYTRGHGASGNPLRNSSADGRCCKRWRGRSVGHSRIDRRDDQPSGQDWSGEPARLRGCPGRDELRCRRHPAGRGRASEQSAVDSQRRYDRGSVDAQHGFPAEGADWSGHQRGTVGSCRERRLKRHALRSFRPGHSSAYFMRVCPNLGVAHFRFRAISF